MKLVYFFLFYITDGIIPLKGQLHLEFDGGMLLRFVFNPKYNNNQKSCCKFTRSRCIKFVTSDGAVHNAYKGRIEIYEYPGTFDIQIWNLRDSDAGLYRCEILGTHYQYFNVGVGDHKTVLNPTSAFPEPSIEPGNQSINFDHNLFKKHHEIPSTKWSLKWTLVTVFSSFGIILTVSMSLAVVYYRRKSTAKCHRRPSCAPNPTQKLAQELIYTTVDFTAHQKTSTMYTNPDIQRPGSANKMKTQENVEYATITGLYD